MNPKIKLNMTGRDLLDLTPAQFETLVTFMDFRERHGLSPTYDELAEILGLVRSTCRTRIKYLIAKGYLVSVGAHRGLQVTSKVELLA